MWQILSIKYCQITSRLSFVNTKSIFAVLFVMIMTSPLHAKTLQKSWYLASSVDEILMEPYLGVGTLVNHILGGWCTAFAVSKNVVLTNAHCLSYLAYIYPDKPNFMIQKDVSIEMIHFYFAVHDMHYQSKHKIKSIEKGPRSSTGKPEDDWAILVLENSIEGFQSNLIIGLPSLQIKTPIQLIGYPNTSIEAVAQISKNCEITTISPNANYFTHNCESTFGSSGSPVLSFLNGRYYLLGLVHGHHQSTQYSTPTGIAVNIFPLANRIKAAVQNNDPADSN